MVARSNMLRAILVIRPEFFISLFTEFFFRFKKKRKRKKTDFFQYLQNKSKTCNVNQHSVLNL